MSAFIVNVLVRKICDFSEQFNDNNFIMNVCFGLGFDVNDI